MITLLRIVVRYVRAHVVRDFFGQLLNGPGDTGALGTREQYAVDPECRISVFLHRLVVSYSWVMPDAAKVKEVMETLYYMLSTHFA